MEKDKSITEIVPGFCENAIKVLERRYLSRDKEGRVVETPKEMLQRVSRAVAQADRPYRGETGVEQAQREFYEIMARLEFLPNSPTLMNAGEELGQLSACFVLPVEDSMSGIFEAVKNMALIHKSGGGTGFSFSRLRPKNDMVRSTRGIASGPVSFMKVFDAATETVKQGGTRRGANMGILRVDHPDIMEFLHSKKEHHKLNNFNISVAITKGFMDALYEDQEYDLVNPNSKSLVGRLKAKDIFNEIAHMAWKSGEPGVIFLDLINQDNPTPQLGSIESTNPCGEQPLLPYESCNLGSINLGKLVVQDENGPRIDFEKLGRLTRTAVHFLDNVIDVSKYPLSAIEEKTLQNRKIGLGVMGFADTLIALGIPYDSDRAVEVAEEVMSFISRVSREASVELAKERGSFSNFPGSKYEREGNPLLRNATMTTIAPTGTISILANASSGIEPIFAVAYEKRVLDEERLLEVNHRFLDIARERGFYSEELVEEVVEKGSLSGVEGVPPDVKRIFVSAGDISAEWHVRMQAAFQKYTDNAVSKTVNFSEDAKVADVERVFMLAYEMGCKGITVYRYGSRPLQILYRGHLGEGVDLHPRERAKLTRGTTEKYKIGCGNLYVTVNSDEEGICEVFTALGRAGGCPSQSEATSRLISLGLRSGIDISEVTEQLKGIRCLSSIKNPDVKVLSCPDAIGRAIERYLAVQGIHMGTDELSDLLVCPDCSSRLEQEGGCRVCRNCGYSKCG